MNHIAVRQLVTLPVSCSEDTGLATKLVYTFCFTIFLVPLLLSGCGGTGDYDACHSQGCTADFKVLHLLVIDQNGNPVTDVSITVKIKATQEVLAIHQDIIFTNPGLYDVFDDGFVNTITTDAAGDTLIVTGNSQGRNFSVEIVVKTDPCRCHFQKVSGPSSVTL